MNKLVYKPKEFYQPIIDVLKSYGLEFMAWVTINNKIVPSHVPALAAQDSRIFFQLPGRSMILLLGYSEWFSKEKLPTAIEEGLWYQGYWHGEIWVSYNRMSMALDLLNAMREQKGHEFADIYDVEIPSIRTIINEGENFLTFGSNGYGINFEEHSRNFDIFEGLKVFSSIIEQFGPYMDKKFDELGVVGFAPYYAFPKCEKIFWNNFPFHRLRSKVRGEIYGNN